jgi:hypothetical protein
MAIIELQYLVNENRVHFCYVDSKNHTIEGDVISDSVYTDHWENWGLYETNSDRELDLDESVKWGILAATNDMIKRKIPKRKTFIPEIGYGDTLTVVIMPFQFIRKDGTKVKGKIRATEEHRIDGIESNVKLTRIEKQILTEMAFDLIDIEL